MKIIKSNESSYSQVKKQIENKIKFLKENQNIVQSIDFFEKKVDQQIHICILLQHEDPNTLIPNLGFLRDHFDAYKNDNQLKA